MLRATQPITMSKMFLVASAMPRMGTLPALLTVANVVSVANSNFQLATLVLIIGNILTLATFSKTRLKIRRCVARLFDFDGFWLIVLAVSRKKKYNKRIYENMVDLLVWHNKE